MKKYVPFLVVFALILSSVACRLSPFASNQQITPPTAVQIATLAPVPVLPDIPTSPKQNPQEAQDLLVAIYQRVDPGVVAIQVLQDNGSGGLGSGFVFDKQGHIVTNYHVVEGAKELEVDFPSGLKVRGEVIGTDLDSDLAVIKVSAPEDQLQPLPLGDSDQAQIGQTVVAIGNPFGLNGTMTVGIVSAKGRTLDSIREAPGGGAFSAGDIIQTDAAITPGNSGGPLLNLKGEVIGINRAIRTSGTQLGAEPQNSGVGFAISSNIVRRVVPSLIEKGSYDYPYLGLSSRPDLSLLDQEALGLSQAVGAYVMDVVPGGPADKAGLRGGTKDTEITGLQAGGDLIIAVDGRPVRIFGDMLGYLMTAKGPGDQIVVTVLRDGEKKEVTITLGKRP